MGEQELSFWQELITFLFQTHEGRGVVSTVITAMTGVLIRLLLLTGKTLIERRELSRLESQHELEAEVQAIREWMEGLGIELEDLKQVDREVGTNVRTNVPHK